jgi:hypothetical protein
MWIHSLDVRHKSAFEYRNEFAISMWRRCWRSRFSLARDCADLSGRADAGRGTGAGAGAGAAAVIGGAVAKTGAGDGAM